VEHLLDALGVSRGTSHPDLLELARGPRQALGIGEGAEAQPLAGSPCPLCRFPTFCWADLAAPGAPPIFAAVQDRYPNWGPADGLCGNCFDLFAIRDARWSTPEN